MANDPVNQPPPEKPKLDLDVRRHRKLSLDERNEIARRNMEARGKPTLAERNALAKQQWKELQRKKAHPHSETPHPDRPEIETVPLQPKPAEPAAPTYTITDTYSRELDIAAARVAAKHPEIAPHLIDAVKEAYKSEAGRHSAAMNDIINQRTPQGAPADRAWMRRKSYEENNLAVKNIFNRVKAQHGDEGAMAMRAFVKETRQPTVIESAVGQFYDDGFKLGGLFGGLVGGAMAYVMAGSIGGVNTWIKLGAILLATVVGGWAGNQATDTIGKYVTWGGKKKQPPGADKSPQPEKSNEPQPEKTNEITPEILAKTHQPAATKPEDKTPATLPDGETVAPTPGIPPKGADNAAAPARQ